VGGMNIPHLFAEQGILNHIHTILKFGGLMEDMTGSLIQVTWEDFVLEMGLAGNIFEFPQYVQAYVMPIWVSTT